MAKVLAATLGVLVTASFVVAACGDDYSDADAPATPPAQGALDGACYANNTCNDGLSCQVVAGQAKCRPTSEVTGNDAASDSASLPADTADAAADVTSNGQEGGSTTCAFAGTPFPCQASGSVLACYGQAHGCTTEACDSNAHPWKCHVPSDCTAQACCLSNVPLLDATTCANNELDVSNAKSKTRCVDKCGTNELTMCRNDLDCSTAAQKVCRPFTVTDGPLSINGVIVGICQK